MSDGRTAGADRVSVIFSGAIREPHLMLDALDWLLSRETGPLIDEAVVSTWFGDVERYPGLDRELRLRGVSRVVATEPIAFRASPARYTARGHIFHQLLALRLALENVGGSGRIVKSRSDLKLHDRSDLQKMIEASSLLPVAARARPFSRLEYRLRVQDVSVAYPFYIQDTHFSGAKSDLLGMTEFDAGYDFFYNPHVAIPEIRFFHAPFRDVFPALEFALRTPFLIHKYEPRGRHEEVLGILLRDPCYLKALACYWWVCGHFFEIADLPVEPERTVEALSSQFEGELGHLADLDALERILARCRSEGEDALATMAGANYAGEDEYRALAAKLRPIAANVLPRVEVSRLVLRRPEEPSGDVRDGPVGLPGIGERLRTVKADESSFATLVADISENLAMGCSFSAPAPSGTVSVLGSISVEPAGIIWTSEMHAHLVQTVDYDDGSTSTSELAIHHDVVSDYFFFSEIARAGIGVPTRCHFAVVIEGRTLPRRWTFDVPAGRYVI